MEYSWCGPFSIAEVHPSLILLKFLGDHPQMGTFKVPSSWKTALSNVTKSNTCQDEEDYSTIVAIVKGAKRTGKSTFARTLLNNLLSRHRTVAFLECDPGQTEFTPPGLVALHIIGHPIFGGYALFED